MIIERTTGISIPSSSLSGGLALICMIGTYSVSWAVEEILSWHAFHVRKDLIGVGIASGLFLAYASALFLGLCYYDGQCYYAGLEASRIFLRSQDSDYAATTGFMALLVLAPVMPALFSLTLKRLRRYAPDKR